MVTRRGPIRQAVDQAVQAATLKPQDAAAVALIEAYAALVDADVETLPDVGPKLLRALESLGMTPAGRVRKEGQGASPTSGAGAFVDELRARRARRAGPTGT